MKPIYVCHFVLGPLVTVNLFAVGGGAGRVLPPQSLGNGQPAQMDIGVETHWQNAYVNLLHEITEYTYITMCLTLMPDAGVMTAGDQRWFHFNHPHFTEANGRIGMAMREVEPMLHAVWKKVKRRKKRCR